MDEQVLLQVEHVSKRFARSLKRALWYGVRDLAGELLAHNGRPAELRPSEFWAVDDVSFEVRRGECLGLIGPNGAGKSTLLKLLSGLIKPDRGRITVRGRVGALIELGAGFNPILTGRENIYVNAAIHGIRKREIDRKFDEIIDFAEIDDFVDTPVQSYSSGMKVRLGFAVATRMEPDVLLLDEVLAVGDVGFRSKCYNRVAEMATSSAVVFVSHAMQHVHRYAGQVFLLHHGASQFLGDTAEGIDRYYSLFDQTSCSTRVTKEGNELHALEFRDERDRPIVEAVHGQPLRIKVEATVDQRISRPVVQLAFLNREWQVAAICISEAGSIRNDDGHVCIAVDINPLMLTAGDYKLSLVVFDEAVHTNLIWHHAAWDLKVTGTPRYCGPAATYFDAAWTQTHRTAAA